MANSTITNNLVGGGGEAASQADQETGTSTTTFVSPGRQQYHPSAAKFWVKYNSVTTTAIDSSYNVTSLTDNGAGDTSITIATDFSSADYAFSFYQSVDEAGSVRSDQSQVQATITAGVLRIATHDGSANGEDKVVNCAIGYGDQ